MCVRVFVCLCVCLCVCVFVTIIRTGQFLAKIKNVKNDVIDFGICNLPAILPVLYFVTMTNFLKVKYFKSQYLENSES